MKPLPTIVLSGAICALALSSCKKHVDPPTVQCRITQLQEWYQRTSADSPILAKSIAFSYNSDGDLTRMTVNPSNDPHLDAYYFTYDNRHRLKTFSSTRTDGIYNYIHKYYYDSNNSDRIARDSFFYYGTDPNDTHTFAGWWEDVYSYDAQGRIAAYTRNSPLPSEGGPAMYTIYYDARGNKYVPNSVPVYVYDDKPNFLRTNPVLQFITRDYSVNNSVVAESYNSSGLPTWFSPNQETTLQIWFLDFNVNKIIYSCDGAGEGSGHGGR